MRTGAPSVYLVSLGCVGFISFPLAVVAYRDDLVLSLVEADKMNFFRAGANQ